MKPPSSRFQQPGQEHSGAQEQSAKETAGEEFDSPEALLRFDAAQTEVPADVARRLNETLRAEPQPPRPPWWRRLMGGS